MDNISEQFAALAAMPGDAPVVMVNLLKFKEDGGLERYLQYGREVAPHLQRVDAKVRYGGTAPAVILGDGKRPWWDAILIVEYARSLYRHGDHTGIREGARAPGRGAGPGRSDRGTSVWTLAE